MYTHKTGLRPAGKADRQSLALVACLAVGFASGFATRLVTAPPPAAPKAAAPTAASPAPTATATDLPPHYEMTVDNVLIRVNEARLAKGLKALGDSVDLDAGAKERLQEIELRGCGHDDLRAHRAAGDYPFTVASEAISCDAASAKDAVDGLLASPTHADILLDPQYTSVGIATDSRNAELLFSSRARR